MDIGDVRIDLDDGEGGAGGQARGRAFFIVSADYLGEGGLEGRGGELVGIVFDEGKRGLAPARRLRENWRGMLRTALTFAIAQVAQGGGLVA